MSNAAQNPEQLLLSVYRRCVMPQPADDRAVLVAVSGGADSMALLHAAHRLSKDTGIRVTAAHLIHHPRSRQANLRAELVRDYCRRHRIELVVEKLQMPAGSRLSPEERMRKGRYRFLEEAARKHSSSHVLTGHHADDQAETILLRVLTGTGLRGLAGIQEKRDKFLRPFLSLRKSDLIAYCRRHRVPYAEDPTNLDQRYPRNRLRHEIIPLLQKKMNPDVVSALCRLGRWTGEANEVLERMTLQCWEASLTNFQKDQIVLDLDVILTYFKMIQKYTILKAIGSVAGGEVRLSAQELDRIAEFLENSRTGAYLEFPGGVRISRDRQRIIVTAENGVTLKRRLIPGVDEEIPELNARAVWSRPKQAPFKVGNGNTADMELGPSIAELIFRFARDGDRFRPLGAGGEKRLFRFLSDKKVPRFEKRQTPVLERDGEVIWVVGHRISEKVRVASITEDTWRLSLVNSK